MVQPTQMLLCTDTQAPVFLPATNIRPTHRQSCVPPQTPQKRKHKPTDRRYQQTAHHTGMMECDRSTDQQTGQGSRQGLPVLAAALPSCAAAITGRSALPQLLKTMQKTGCAGAGQPDSESCLNHCQQPQPLPTVWHQLNVAA